MDKVVKGVDTSPPLSEDRAWDSRVDKVDKAVSTPLSWSVSPGNEADKVAYIVQEAHKVRKVGKDKKGVDKVVRKKVVGKVVDNKQA